MLETIAVQLTVVAVMQVETMDRETSVLVLEITVVSLPMRVEALCMQHPLPLELWYKIMNEMVLITFANFVEVVQILQMFFKQPVVVVLQMVTLKAQAQALIMHAMVQVLSVYRQFYSHGSLVKMQLQ